MNNITKKYINEIKNNEITPADVKVVIKTPMSNVDIEHYFPDAKIIEVSDLGEFKTINDLLPYNCSYVFLLYESSNHSGHWVLLVRYNKTIEYFDSYGTMTNKYGFKTSIDAPLKWLDNKENEALNNQPYLTNLLLDSPFELIYNAYDFQKHSTDISTCGRWDVLRLMTIKKYAMSLNGFIKMIKKIKKATKMTNDEIVSDLINKI